MRSAGQWRLDLTATVGKHVPQMLIQEEIAMESVIHALQIRLHSTIQAMHMVRIAVLTPINGSIIRPQIACVEPKKRVGNHEKYPGRDTFVPRSC